MTPLNIPIASGIYRITCIITKKSYIGSTVNLHKRCSEHFYALQRKDHPNPYLQNVWNKYGEQSFIFEVLEYVLSPFLLEREQYWLDKLKPFAPHKGFNIAHSTQTSRLGLPHSLATRTKMSESQIGRQMSPETRAKLSTARTGQKASPETRAKVSAAGLGRPMSPKSRALADARGAARRKTLIVTAPDGTEQTILGIRPFCREHNLSYSALLGVAKGKCRQHKGWHARFPEADVS